MKPQTVTKKKKPSKKKVKYSDIRSEVEKPFNERTALAIGRGMKMRTPRKHHLTDEEKIKLHEEANALGYACINPFRGRAGLYFGQVEALIQLGINEWHSFKTVRDKIEVVLTAEKTNTGRTAWDNAKNRKPKKDAVAPQSIEGRIKTNFKTLQRLPEKTDKNPYGIKLRQFGLCVDIEYRKNDFGIAIPWYRINTNGLSVDESLKADDLIEDGVLNIKPYTSNPFSKRGPKPKSKGKSGDGELSGDGDEVSQMKLPAPVTNPGMTSSTSSLKLTDD